MLKPTHSSTEARQIAIGLAAILLALLLLPAAQAHGKSSLFGAPPIGTALEESIEQEKSVEKKEATESVEITLVEEIPTVEKPALEAPTSELFIPSKTTPLEDLPAVEIHNRSRVFPLPPMVLPEEDEISTVAPITNTTPAPKTDKVTLKVKEIIEELGNAEPIEIPEVEAATEETAKSIASTVISLPPPPADPTEDPLDFAPAIEELSQRLQPEVKEGFNLGRAGALYAARRQFISVLRKVALAKDSADESVLYSDALAEGLRALDEADDFLPRGEALEAELNTFAIARSHSTPVVRLSNKKRITPHQALAEYSQHAADCLAEAVENEQAGSMALYGLGKTYARLAVQGDDPNASRKSAVLYRAALVAHRDNYLAANELGVYLARAGRYEQAAPFLRLAAENDEAPAAIYTNLAMVQRKTGQFNDALNTEEQGVQVASAEVAAGKVSQRHGIEWVNPAAFRGGTPKPTNQQTIKQASATPASPSPPATAGVQKTEAGWRGWVQQAKRATGWSGPEQGSAPAPPVSQPYSYNTAEAPSMQRVTR